MKKITILDIVIVSLSVALLLTLLAYSFISRREGGRLIIKSGDHEYYYSLNRENVVPIEGRLGVTTVEINEGRFRFSDSPCKNRTCINHGWIKSGGFPLICLPNGVTAYIEASDEAETGYDGVSF